MEDVLSVYHRPYDEQFPVVCLDEAAKQILSDEREPLPMKCGQVERFDNEYRRDGTAALFMAFGHRFFAAKRPGLRAVGRCLYGNDARLLILLRSCDLSSRRSMRRWSEW